MSVSESWTSWDDSSADQGECVLVQRIESLFQPFPSRWQRMVSGSQNQSPDWCGYCSTLGLVPVLSVARRAGARGCHLCVPWCSRFSSGSATASMALLDILLPLTPKQQKTQVLSWLMAPVPFVQWCPRCCFKISAAAIR